MLAPACPGWRIGMTAPAASPHPLGPFLFPNEKPGFWPGEFENIPNVMKRWLRETRWQVFASGLGK